MIDLHYSDARLAALYDLDSGWSEDRDFYLALADRPGMAILDLGCGTGLLCDAYAAQGHRVTGVDPAAAMLDQARQKPYGGAVTWVQSTAQGYQSDQRFDLVIMTGHAFQVLLQMPDILATFHTVRAHLRPQGRFVFESRNPAVDWGTRWNTDAHLTHLGQPLTQSRRFLGREGDLIRFETSYQFGGQSLVSQSTLRFLSAPQIVAALASAGLRVDTIRGGWRGQTFDPAASEEMVFTARRSDQGAPNSP